MALTLRDGLNLALVSVLELSHHLDYSNLSTNTGLL